MSETTFKNLLNTREHRERSQPQARKKYGLLEKHKDYVKRAKNYHDKEKRISALKRKAANRNPDEFYFKMTGTATKNGVHKEVSTSKKFDAEELKMLKSQDVAYLQTMKSREDKVS